MQYKLVRSDPFPRQHCHRNDCPLDDPDGCKERCFQGHVNYTIQCKKCGAVSDEESEKCVYCGESSRGCYVRFKGHCELCKQGKGWMYKHIEEHHKNEEVRPEEIFKMSRVSVDSDPIRRVIREAVKIADHKKREKKGELELMNTKEEFYGPRLVVPVFNAI